ncbi:ABC transporter permease subunit [Candidatus Viridilinea mediisalina]|uniref:Uncharacterized protein n=1 Tax=Candidatus Viridilinea mediisalina TaxID=2024553 RepID=A0A2A6RJS1_9CHLR|nr:ABC transporter permease subunit [Candidatus Viridilinea mediisalina]PDW03364.1 hypothetical protein CJ255_09265 [Candidatus Viridilinea mediisalina]
MIALPIGAIVLLQDAIIEEKQNGIAEWILAKPVARPAYVLAKLWPNMLAMAITMLLIPGSIGFIILRIFAPDAIALSGFLSAYGIVALHLCFYINLSLMLGVLLKTRGPLLSISLGSLLGGTLVPIAAIVQFTPWKLSELVVLPVLGSALPAIASTMLISSALWSILFIGVALWRIGRIEL